MNPRLFSRLPAPVAAFFNRVRKDPLRRYIYLLLWPWFIPVVGYLIFGDAFMAGWQPFLTGVLVLVVACTVANEVDTYALLRIIRAYPNVGQTLPRMGWMIFWFGLLNGILAESSLRLFDATSFLNYTYQPGTNTWVLSFVFISSVVAAALVESAYALTQWQTNQLDKQHLERQNLQFQVDSLKSRINPHFLFNSLNSISSLIADEPQQAEQFVDEMAKVYRYMLQAGNQTVVPLAMELDFLSTYTSLLTVRYGDCLRIVQHIPACTPTDMLPPLTLQILIDNAIRHNLMTPTRPLIIRVALHEGQVQVSNTLQRKVRRIDTGGGSLASLSAKYRLLGNELPIVTETPTQFSVTLPRLIAG